MVSIFKLVDYEIKLLRSAQIEEVVGNEKKNHHLGDYIRNCMYKSVFCVFYKQKNYTRAELNDDFLMGFEYHEKSITDMATEEIFSKGCIPDEKSAAVLAKLIIKLNYGQYYFSTIPFYYKIKPLLIAFDETNQVWLIKTQFPGEGWLGVTVYIIIKKSNAEVVSIWADR